MLSFGAVPLSQGYGWGAHPPVVAFTILSTVTHVRQTKMHGGQPPLNVTQEFVFPDFDILQKENAEIQFLQVSADWK